MNKEPVKIELQNIFKAYIKDNYVLENINLTIDQGQFISLRGPSGCGKSTLLNLIAGLDKPTSGIIRHNSINLSKLNDNQLADYRANYLGFVFQFFNLLPSLTIYENVKIALDLINYKDKANQLIDKILADVQMQDFKNYYPAQLSGGQMQRVAIARAIVHSPKIIIADEPTGNLDSNNGIKIMELLTNLNKNLNITIILVTHDENVSKYADRTINIKDGKIV